MIRLFDILLSSIAILILFPFMIPIMVALKLTGEHDIFYTQERTGKNKKVFKVLKFATMLRNSPNMAGGLITIDNDPRILPMGKFLRKTKINELPQLVNIFLGQMSIIGYRPFALKHYSLYEPKIQETISKIPPGLSGIGSIVFRNEEQILQSLDNREYFHDELITPYKGLLECWYVENRNLKNYFKLIFYTILVVITPDNSSWKKMFPDLPPIPEELKAFIE
ncbi:sugar transferase [Spirochaetota bacterium]